VGVQISVYERVGPRRKEIEFGITIDEVTDRAWAWKSRDRPNLCDPSAMYDTGLVPSVGRLGRVDHQPGFQMSVIVKIFAFTCATCVWAHHSFMSEYDTKRSVHLEGLIASFEFVNPHAEIYLDDATGRWRIEGSSPSALQRRGISKVTVHAGMRVRVDGYQARDGSLRVYGIALALPDGSVLFLNPPTELWKKNE